MAETDDGAGPRPGTVHDAAAAGDTAALARSLLADATAAHARGWMGATPLHAAAEGGSAAAADLLLAAGADPRARRTRGDVPLHWAASAEVAEVLIAADPTGIDRCDDLGRAPLHRARSAEVAAALLRHGAPVASLDTRGRTPLHDADDVGLTRVLLRAGADPNAADHVGRTPLHEAVWTARLDVVVALLAAGADPAARDDAGTSSLHLARRRAPDQVRTLLDASARRGEHLAATVALADTPALAHHSLQVDALGALTITGPATLVGWSLPAGPTPVLVAATDEEQLGPLALRPDGELVLVGRRGAPVEVYDRMALERRESLAALPEATALAFSPDGRRLALATRDERVLLVEWATREVVAEVEGGEWTAAVGFSPDGAVLAAACSFQGGAHVQLCRVGPAGTLHPVGTVDRADHRTPPERFVDALPALAFAPEGLLAVWESSTIHHHARPPGWRGDLVVLDPVAGRVLWERSVDVGVTGDGTPMTAAGYRFGCSAPVAVTGGLVAIGLDGRVVLLAARTGAFVGTMATTGVVRALAPDPAGGALLVAAGAGLHRLALPRS